MIWRTEDGLRCNWVFIRHYQLNEILAEVIEAWLIALDKATPSEHNPA